MQSALKFYDYKNKYIESGKNYNVDIKIEDIQQFKPVTKYDLITACWCLGFFKDTQALEILRMVHDALQIDGSAFFKESVQPEDGGFEGRDGYENRSRDQIESLFA